MIEGSGASKVLGGSESDLSGNISRVSGRWRKKMSRPMNPSRIGQAIGAMSQRANQLAAKTSVSMKKVNQKKDPSSVAGNLYIKQDIDDTYFKDSVVKRNKEKIK